MEKGKRQKIEKIIYTVFKRIQNAYQLSGLLFLYESVRLLLPAFLLVPYKMGATTIFIPNILLRSKKHGMALHALVASVKLAKKTNSTQKIETIILETLLYLVLEKQNTSLTKKYQTLETAFANRKFVHYRW
jgi:ribosomal protein S7